MTLETPQKFVMKLHCAQLQFKFSCIKKKTYQFRCVEKYPPPHPCGFTPVAIWQEKFGKEGDRGRKVKVKAITKKEKVKWKMESNWAKIYADCRKIKE